jgi:serine/threonine-protein kinase RsbW
MAVPREPVLATMTLPAEPAAAALGIAFVAKRAIAEGIPPKRVAEIELPAEEALVNIYQYAYRNKVGRVEVRCARNGAQQFVIELIDTGEPFNILTLPSLDLTADLEQRLVGGLAVLFIRALMDHVAYRREGARNILQLMVQLPH